MQATGLQLAFALLWAACLAFASAAAAQEPRMARIGYLSASHAMQNDALAAAFLRGLAERGYVEGRNVVFVKRAALGKFERLPALARELVEEKVDVIVAPPLPAALAAIRATSTIPVVFMLVADPVAAGLAKSLARPGGNATGLSNQSEDVAAKMLEILGEAVPRMQRVAVLTRKGNAAHDAQWKQLEAAAVRLRAALQRMEVEDYAHVEVVLTQLTALKPHGVILLSDPTFVSRREHITATLNAMRTPAIYGFAEFTDAGGLMSYGVNLADTFRRGALYVDRILKGASPADMPIEQPSRFELSINLGTAVMLGLEIPRELRLRADRLVP